MEAGKLRNRITIQQRTLTPDSYGQSVESWTDFATVWAEIRSISGRESLIAEAMQGITNYEVNIRYKAGVVQSMRIIYKNHILDVQSVINDMQANKKLTLFCVEGLSDG